MNLKDLVTEEVNTVELYFCPEKIPPHANLFTCGWKQLPRLPLRAFKNRMDQSLVEYSYRDMIYQYDTGNDAQKVLQRTWVKDKIYDTNYVLVLQEETLPTHRFPSTMEMNDKKKLHKIQYKINNRIFFHLDKDEQNHFTMYLRYNHAHNVDLDKIQEEWDDIYKQLKKHFYP
jgi:hypothetical protein